MKRPPSAPHTYYKGRMHWCWIFLQSFPVKSQNWKLLWDLGPIIRKKNFTLHTWRILAKSLWWLSTWLEITNITKNISLRQFVKYKTSVCLSNSYQYFPILYRFVNGGIFWPKCFISQQFSESPFVCDAIMNDRSNFNENLVDNIMSKVYYLHQNFLI